MIGSVALIDASAKNRFYYKTRGQNMKASMTDVELKKEFRALKAKNKILRSMVAQAEEIMMKMKDIFHLVPVEGLTVVMNPIPAKKKKRKAAKKKARAV